MQDSAYYRMINAGGNHYDIGRKMTDAITDELLSRLTSPVDRARMERAIELANVAFAEHPVLRDEMQGIAEGISIDIEAMLCEITQPAVPAGTVTALAMGEQGIVVGRSFIAPSSAIVRNLLRLDPNDSYASLGSMGGQFAGTWESTSVFGFAVCADALGDGQGKGVAPYMIPRMATEKCKTSEAAMELLRSIPVMQPCRFLLVDREHALSIHRDSTGSSVEELQLPAVLFGGQVRQGQRIEADAIGSFLASHDGGCVHGENETIYAFLIDMGKEDIQYSGGPPCKAQFRQIDWPGGYA